MDVRRPLRHRSLALTITKRFTHKNMTFWLDPAVKVGTNVVYVIDGWVPMAVSWHIKAVNIAQTQR
jgi:hypothetical protein